MVNIYKLELTTLQQEIVNLLFIKIGPLNGRRISQILGVSPPAIGKALPELERKEYIILKKDRESGRLSREINRNSAYMIALKRIENLKNIYRSGLTEYLYDLFPGNTIILFGSYALGEDTTSSDIDLAIIGAKEREKDLTKFEKVLERPIFLHFYPS